MRFCLTFIRMVKIKTQAMTHAKKNVKKGEHAFILGRTANLHGQYQNQYDGSSKY